MTERTGRPVICISGTGRCGTSLTTELIAMLGLDVGPPDGLLPPHAKINARGFWEQYAIYELNEAILAAFGGTWERPPELPQGWEADRSLDDLRVRAGHALVALFGTAPERFAMKDPRFSVTAPFWRGLVGEMDHVICVRHPADVLASIMRTGSTTIDATEAAALWTFYTRAALAGTDPAHRLIVSYEDYFTDTEPQLRRLTGFVCGPGAGLDAGTQAALARCVEPTLWHNRDGAQRVGEVVAATPDALDLYAALRAEAAGASAPRADR